MASYGPAQFIALVQTLGATIQSLQSQLEWFQRQMFGTKSERLRVLESAQQLALGEVLAAPSQTVPAQGRLVAAHTRREPQRDAAVGEADSVPFFDATLGSRLCGSIGVSKAGIPSCTCTCISPDSACRNWSPFRCRISPRKTGKNWTNSCVRTSRPCPRRSLIGL